MSPAPIYLPQQQNPWSMMLPKMAGQVISGAIQSKFDRDLFRDKSKIESANTAEERIYKQGEFDRQAKTKQTNALALESSKTRKGETLEGDKFFWRWDPETKAYGKTNVPTKGDKPASTAWAQILKQNPNMTTDEVIATAKKMQSATSLKVGADGSIEFLQGPESTLPITGKIRAKELESLRAQERTVSDLLRVSGDIQKIVKNDPTVIGGTGWTVRTIDSLNSQLQGVIGSIIPKTTTNIHIDASKFNFDKFQGQAVKSAQVKSKVVNLAYKVARIREPDARQFSQGDIQAAIDEIGSGTGSPAQFQGVLDSIQKDSVASYMAHYKKSEGMPYLPKGLTEEDIAAYEHMGKSRVDVITRYLKVFGG